MRVVAFATLLAACLLPLYAGCASNRVSPCSINTDCHSGSYCISGTCRTDCRADYDCTVGHCELAIGRCVAGAPVDASMMADTPLDMTTPPDLTNPTPPDFSFVQPDQPDLAQPAGGVYGDVCAHDTDCANMICSHDPFTSNAECTGPCKSDLDCMIGDFCVTTANLDICAQSDIGNTCKQAADCRMGACLGNAQDGPAYCTRLCASAADCPSGYSCSLVDNTSFVCVALDSTLACGGNTACYYDTLCDGTVCLGDCRDQADCPLENTCQSSYCLPASTGGGGIGAACNTANDCRAGRCAANVCVGACGVTADRGQFCPAGYGCSPFGDGMGGYLLACAAAGTGEIGSACVDNTSCGSAVCFNNLCSRFCNDAPCPSVLPHCDAAGVVADGVTLKACAL